MIWGAFFMLKIFFFVTVTFFFVTGLITAFVFIYLRLCAPTDKSRIFEIYFYPTGSYILELKWLITVFSLFGVSDRIALIVDGEGLGESEKRELRAVFGSCKNVILKEKDSADEKSRK